MIPRSVSDVCYQREHVKPLRRLQQLSTLLALMKGSIQYFNYANILSRCSLLTNFSPTACSVKAGVINFSRLFYFITRLYIYFIIILYFVTL